MEVTQRVVRSIGVDPEPVNVALVDGCDDAVLSKNLAVEKRFADRDRVTGQGAVAIDAGPRHPIEALGEIEPAHGDPPRSSRGDFERVASKSQAVLLGFV